MATATNGSSSSQTVDLEEQLEASEDTPLLSSHDHIRYIDPVVDRWLAEPNIQDGFIEHAGSSTVIGRAFDTLVLLHLKTAMQCRSRRDIPQTGANLSIDDLSSVDHGPGVAVVERTLMRVTEDIMGHLELVKDLEAYLMTSFAYNEKSARKTRLIDLLDDEQTYETVFRTRPSETVLSRIWTRGYTIGLSRKGIVQRATRRMGIFCTPRVMHALDLIFFLVYFVALVHYTVQPPSFAVEPVQTLRPGLRETIVMVYAFAQLFKSWEVTVAPFIVTLLSFLSCLPSVPRPEDGAYSALLLAVSLHLLQLHLPRSPSPVLLFPFDLALPLATLIQHGIFKIFIPVIAFFLPALLLALFLLSTSLSDLLQHFTITTITASPLEARTAFLTLLAIVFILLLCSLMMLILVYPNLTSQDPPPARWDRFSRPIGSEARRSMVAIVAKYSHPTSFPPPLNLVQFVCVRTPSWVLYRLGRTHWQDRLSSVDEILWLVAVVPFAFVVQGLYLWGYV